MACADTSINIYVKLISALFYLCANSGINVYHATNGIIHHHEYILAVRSTRALCQSSRRAPAAADMATRAAPFDSLRVADIGDVAINLYNLLDSIDRIERAYREILEHDCKLLTLGGDHTIALPILRAIHAKRGKVGLIHVDAHADVNDTVFGEKIAHGTPFRRAVEEGLLDCERVV